MDSVTAAAPSVIKIIDVVIINHQQYPQCNNQVDEITHKDSTEPINFYYNLIKKCMMVDRPLRREIDIDNDICR